MSEEVRPFEEYKEMIKDMRKEEMIKGLYDLSKNVIEKENKIEKIQRQKEELQINGLRQETLFKLEIERLNNIINELEKYLQENINNIYTYFDNTPFGVEETYKEVLSKLQELKENNNGVWVNSLLEVIKENDIEFGSDKE